MKGEMPGLKKFLLFKRLPWIVAGIMLAVAVLIGLLLAWRVAALPGSVPVLLAGAGLLAALVAYRVTAWVQSLYQQQDALQQRSEAAERNVERAHQQVGAILRISQKFVEASAEQEVIDLALRLSLDLTGATGASLVPLDEYGQPLAAVSRGELPFPVMNEWLEYLASPAIRERCGSCKLHGTRVTANCPLLEGPLSGAIGLFCLPLRRGEREFGVLNLFVPNVTRLDETTQAFLAALLDQTALALEGLRLRRSELAALRQLQAGREKTDLDALLLSVVESLSQTLEADLVLLEAPQPWSGRLALRLTSGKLPVGPFLESISQGVMRSREPVLLGDIAGDQVADKVANLAANLAPRSLLAVPLHLHESAASGTLLVASRRPHAFHPRQLALLQTIAGQVALIVQNANRMAELEFKVISEERTRLAREIHDGLAQTLGFLKLQVAQMQTYLARGDQARLIGTMDLCYTTLSEAFQDARQAIDDLRIRPDEGGLPVWLAAVAADFGELTGLRVDLKDVHAEARLAPEVQAQLIRIVQEALNNVRKHARASQVWITFRRVEAELWLEVRDDGRGFAPEDISGPSRHGLRGMRERAELIGADFQVISCPKEGGTTVRVALPLHADPEEVKP